MLNVDSYEIDRISKLPEKNWWPSQKSTYQKYTHGFKRRRLKRTDIDEYHEHTLRLCVAETVESFPQKFKRLVAEWREESIFMSSMNEMVMLRSYLAIIGMGPSVVPLILNELKQRPTHLFWALEIITGANPVSPDDEGRLDRMAAAWIKWGEEKRII